MKKVIVTILLGILLVGFISSCDKGEVASESDVYSIDNDEIKDSDI